MTTEAESTGILEGDFGKSGKFNVRISEAGVASGTPVTLRFRNLSITESSCRFGLSHR